jgi:drug/metabolite transporter (DMT)-like permease
MTLSWFPYSILATVLLGITMALYKLPARHKQSVLSVNTWALILPALLSLAFFFPRIQSTTPLMVISGFIWGASFAVLAALQMRILRHVETNTAVPVTATASLVITILVGVIALREYITLFQTFGIFLVVCVVFFALYKGKLYPYALLGTGGLIVALSVVNKLVQKIAVDVVDIRAYQIYQYGFAALCSFLLFLIVHRSEWRTHFFEGRVHGTLIGIFSFLGGYVFLIALSRGPFPLVTGIHSLYVLVTAFVGAALFQERLTKKKIALLFFAIIAILFIRLG